MAVDAARDGADGLRLALSGPYDLVVLDLVMPGMDGHAVFAGSSSASRRSRS